MKNIRKKLTKIELHNCRENYLRRCFENHDRNDFQSFFEDKRVTIRLEQFKGAEKKWDGYACVDCDGGCIGIDEFLFDEIDKAKPKDRPPVMHYIDEVLRHEMLHLFVYMCAPNGRTVWGDRCKVFKELERHYCRKA